MISTYNPNSSYLPSSYNTAQEEYGYVGEMASYMLKEPNLQCVRQEYIVAHV